jgi:hypothetical protein
MRMRSNRNSHSLMIEMQNGAATLKDSVTASYRDKHRLIIWNTVSFPDIYRLIWKLYLHWLKKFIEILQYLYSKSLNWKQLSYLSTCEWMNYGTYTQRNNTWYKINALSDQKHMTKLTMHLNILVSVKDVWKDHMLYYSGKCKTIDIAEDFNEWKRISWICKSR